MKDKRKEEFRVELEEGDDDDDDDDDDDEEEEEDSDDSVITAARAAAIPAGLALYTSTSTVSDTVV